MNAPSQPETATEKQAVLKRLTENVPYVRYMGVQVEIKGDELTCVLPFEEKLIGNPLIRALHGGVTAAFLEITAHVGLTWHAVCNDQLDLSETKLSLPKTIDFSVDYLRTGLPRDAYARARVTRAGRRYASVNVEAWQDTRSRLFAQATGHFLMPNRT